MAEFELKGMRELVAKLKATPAQVERAAGAGLHLFGRRIMDESKRIVPVESGTLKRSGTVGKPEAHGRDVSVQLSYGDDASAYALVQHERTDYQHKEGQQAKYLETPLKQLGTPQGVNTYLVPAIQEALRRICGTP